MPPSRPDEREICFVLMPFGVKPDPSGRQIDFDAVYRDLVAPAIDDVGLHPLRSDEEDQGGVIHKQMFERLLLCPFAVADLSTANPNVYYEVGVRHAARPHTTVMIHSSETDLRFDLAPVRSVLYRLDDRGHLADPAGDRRRLADRLREAMKTGREPRRDSPIFELFPGVYRPPELPHEVCDTFFERVQMAEKTRGVLADLRRRYRNAKDDGSRADVRARVRADLEALEAGCRVSPTTDASTWIALMLTFRACDDARGMLRVIDGLDTPLRRQRMVEQQRAFALNRLGEGVEAQEILDRLVLEHGPDPETCGLLGRVHKDAWRAAEQVGDDVEARYRLTCAIDTYLRGFLADWRDFYPGINAVTLMDAAGDARLAQYLPLVTFSTRRRIETLPPERQDYWEHATMLELAALAGERDEADRWLPSARARHKEAWEVGTTADNLRIIADRRRIQGDLATSEWIERLAAALTA